MLAFSFSLLILSSMYFHSTFWQYMNKNIHIYSNISSKCFPLSHSTNAYLHKSLTEHNVHLSLQFAGLLALFHCCFLLERARSKPMVNMLSVPVMSVPVVGAWGNSGNSPICWCPDSKLLSTSRHFKNEVWDVSLLPQMLRFLGSCIRGALIVHCSQLGTVWLIMMGRDWRNLFQLVTWDDGKIPSPLSLRYCD